VFRAKENEILKRVILRVAIKMDYLTLLDLQIIEDKTEAATPTTSLEHFGF
jgi:hypothetical protein